MHILEVILILGILVLVHELGHFLAAKSIKIPVKQFALGFGPALFSRRWGETEMRLNALPLGGYCAFADDQEEDEKEENPIDPSLMLRNRGWWERAYVISAGVICNFVLAYFVLVAMVAFVGITTPKPGILVGNLLPQMPAIQSGLKTGDTVLRVNEKEIKTGQDFIDTILANSKKPVTLFVQREGKPIQIKVVPNQYGKIGVGIQSRFETRRVKYFYEPWIQGAIQQKEMTISLLEGLGQLVTGKLPLSQVGGPIEIVNIGSKVAQADQSNLFAFTALISIELAIVNFLPLPALDGGLLLLLLIEAVRRRRLPVHMEAVLNQAGLYLLLGLGLLLIVKDLVGIIRPMLRI
ncbi:MAG TPA: RIP metalloprotease RseP [Cyanobacteria bacterium UBA8530]|nr:RIP metalloprotease RseP [Cyanobacteria bacterium UBA8530]